MRILLTLLTLSFMTSVVAADNWQTIRPLDHCQRFEMKFKETNGVYKVRFLEGPSFPQIEHIEQVDDINDLSSIADKLVDAAAQFCPMTISLTDEIETAHCVVDNNPVHYGQQFVELSRQVVKAIDRRGKNCEDVIPYIKLQEKITALEGEELINFDSQAHLFKLFVDDDVDDMIDHFYECGGKKGSKKFLKNVILMETKKACIIPAPPGLMSVDEARQVAEEVVKDLPNMSLLTLKDEIDNLTKKTVLKFTDHIVDKELKNILGEELNTEKFKKKIPSLVSLKKQKDAKVLDHITYITLVDAPFQAVEQAMPVLFNNQLGPMLPETWSDKKKASFIHKNVTSKALAEFNKCTKPIKQRVGYPFKGDFNQTVGHRKNLEKAYCEKHPDQCADKTCGSVKNLFTDRDDVTDMKMLQGCVLKASNAAILPVLSALIRAQKGVMEDFFEVTPDITKSLSKKANDKIMKCVDKEIKKTLETTPNKRFDQDIEILYQVDVGNYVEALTSCAIEAEELITGDVVTLVFNGMDIVKDEFSTGSKTPYSGVQIDKGVLNFSQDVIDSTLPACVESQKEIARTNTNYTASAISCRPVIEIEAASRVLVKSIDKMAKEFSINNKRSYKRNMSNFKRCVEKAKSEVLNAYGNSSHRTPILDAKDADAYLENNHSFNNCIKKTVIKSVDSFADVAISNVLEESKDKLNDPEYALSLKPRVKAVAVECFQEKIKSIKSWPKFIEFNEGAGLEKLQKNCEKRATAFVLPKIILNEAKGQFKTAEELNVLDSENGADNVLKLISQKLQDEYNIPEKIVKVGPELTIRSAYLRHMRKPGATTDSFISKLEYTAGGSTIKKIAKDLVISAVESAKPEHNFDEFKEALTPQCIFEIAHHNKKNIEDIVSGTESDPNTTTDLKKIISDLLAGGLKYAKAQGRYTELVDTAKKICNDPHQYKDIVKLLETRFGDEFILGEVQNQVTNALEKVVVEQCLTSLNEKDIKLSAELEKALCSATPLSSKDDFKLREKLANEVSDKDKRSYLSFILGRKNETINLITNKIKNKAEFDKIFNKDKQFLDYLYQNTVKIIQGDEEVLEAVTIVALNNLFQDKSKDSFGSRMAESQLIAGIGLSGLEIAKAEVKKKTDDLPFLESIFSGTIKAQGPNKLLNNWNYTKLKGYLNWKNIEDKKRQETINEFFGHALIPTAISSEKSVQDKGMAKITERITHMISNEKTYNEKFNPGEKIDEDNPKYLTFTDRISNDITSDIENHIYDKYCINLKCVGDLFDSSGDAGPKPEPTLKGIPLKHFRLNSMNAL